MSTLKTTFIQHPSATEPSIELSADGTIVLPLSDLEDLANVDGTPTDGQFLAWNSATSQWEPTTMSVKEKRIAAFTGSGTWTVPAGVTYAIAHMLGGGGGAGRGSSGNGGTSSVGFAGGTVSGLGGRGQNLIVHLSSNITTGAGIANSGRGAYYSAVEGIGGRHATVGDAGSAQFIVAADTVTPAASITVTVGAGGVAGTSGSAGGTGYVYIEYYEEV
jgi:hypothetical protein